MLLLIYTFSNSIATSEPVCRTFMVKRIGSQQHFVVSKFTKISVRLDCCICISFQFLTMKTSLFSSNIWETILVIFSLFLMYFRKKLVVPCKFQQRQNFQSRFSWNSENLSCNKTTFRGQYVKQVWISVLLLFCSFK